MDFKILNWNIGGAKYLQDKEDEREETRKQLNSELQDLIRRNRRFPDVVTLQEIVWFQKPGEELENIIYQDQIEGYRYYPFSLIDSDRLSSKAKWNKVQKSGGWPDGTYFAQGNATLFRNDVPHFPVWDLSASCRCIPQGGRHFIEQVNLDSGLYFGDRDTEPRAVLVSHFIYNPIGEEGLPLDILVVNLHLTTLMREREGIPEIDMKASKIRLAQLDVVFCGIVSRYNMWKQLKFPERGEKREKKSGETYERYEPVWILAGDFNFTSESVEYESIKRLNFIDVIPIKGSGTKASGAGNPPTLTVDYIFAGPKFVSLDPLITKAGINNNRVDIDVRGSDHYPMYANIPIVPLTSPK